MTYRVAFAISNALACEVQGSQRGRASGVDGDAGSFEVEKPGDAI